MYLAQHRPAEAARLLRPALAAARPLHATGLAVQGYQLLAHRPVPRLFLTSCADDETFAAARLVGPAAYLIKLVEPAALQRAIVLALGSF